MSGQPNGFWSISSALGADVHAAHRPQQLRIIVIRIVAAMHAVVAYLGSSPVSSFNFDDPPFLMARHSNRR
jgi:hypothetical protein